MKLIKDLIAFVTAAGLAALEDEVDLGLTPQAQAFQRSDFRQALAAAQYGQTILFDADQALDLRPALARFKEDVEYRLPFQRVILQFSHPIAEEAFFGHEYSVTAERADRIVALLEMMEYGQILDLEGLRQGRDSVAALLLTQNVQADNTWNEAIAFFSSTALNRVAWRGDTLSYDSQSTVQAGSVEEHNKQQLRALAIACIAYINCANMQLKRVAAPEKVNRKRVKKGKKPLEPYYLVELRPEYASQAGEVGGAGARHVSYKFDVRGHFRRLSDGRLIWVRPHQRGLAHERYIPSVRRVEPEHDQ